MNDDHNDDPTADRAEAGSDGINLDVDIDLKMAQIMTQARDAANAVRETTKAIQRRSQPTLAQADLAAVSSLADNSESEATMAGFVLELERLANGLQGIAEVEDEANEPLAGDNLRPSIQSVPGAKEVEDLVRALRTGHVALTETVGRLRGIVAEAEASANALQDVMRSLEHALGTAGAPGVQDGLLAESTGQVEPSARGGIHDEPLSEDRRDRQTALRALRSLSD